MDVDVFLGNCTIPLLYVFNEISFVVGGEFYSEMEARFSCAF